MSKLRRAKRKTSFFRNQERGIFFLISLFAGLGLLLLVSGLHMSLTGDKEAYYKPATNGDNRSVVGPAFLYLMGGCMLALSVSLLWPAFKKK